MSNHPTIVARFAPSPTGLLHLGHAYAAFMAAEAADRFVVRIEDIDIGRCRPEFAAAILEDVRWLGLAFEVPVLHQSERLAAYRAHLGRLAARGLVYPCFCTRKEILDEVARAGAAPQGPDGPGYPGTCRKLGEKERAARIAAGAVYALRLDVAKAAAEAGDLYFEESGAGPAGECGPIKATPSLFGDVVLARKETPAAYHLASVADDAFQQVTRVTRGNDLFAATHLHRLLQALLHLPTPIYAHHKLILDAHGRKFSKRDDAVTLRHMRERGCTPEDIRSLVLAAAAGDGRITRVG